MLNQFQEKIKQPANNPLSRLTVVIFWTGWISAAGAFLWLALFTISGEELTLVRLVSYVAPWLAGWLGLLALPAIIARKGLLAVFLLLPALMTALLSLNSFSLLTAHKTSGQSYKVMTYSKMGRNGDIDSVARVVLSEKPDVLFMQEINDQETARLIGSLAGIYDGAPLYSFADPHVGLILSRYKVISLRKPDDFSQAAEIEFPENPVRIWNVHLQKSFVDTALQYQMTDQLAEQIGLTSGPIIAAGDFNATALNYPYKRIKEHLENAFENAGSGFGFTFPSTARRLGILTPFMRIDQIFYSQQFNIQKSYVVKESGGSDHYPVVAVFSLKKAES